MRRSNAIQIYIPPFLSFLHLSYSLSFSQTLPWIDTAMTNHNKASVLIILRPKTISSHKPSSVFQLSPVHKHSWSYMTLPYHKLSSDFKVFIFHKHTQSNSTIPCYKHTFSHIHISSHNPNPSITQSTCFLLFLCLVSKLNELPANIFFYLILKDKKIPHFMWYSAAFIWSTQSSCRQVVKSIKSPGHINTQILISL